MLIRPAAPDCVTSEFLGRRAKYPLIIPVWNEGSRLTSQLRRLGQLPELPDIVIVDYASVDGSTDPALLQSLGVRALLTTKTRGLGNALRIGLAFAISEGYPGALMMDGNGKDGVEVIPTIASRLEGGFDLVQASRFLAGGLHENTPVERLLGIRWVVSPLLWAGTGYRYTDPTNGCKGISRRLILDPRAAILRDVFTGFNFQFYLNYIAPRLKMRVCELPTTRVYPIQGPVPTKITGLAARIRLVRQLIFTVCGGYNVQPALAVEDDDA